MLGDGVANNNGLSKSIELDADKIAPSFESSRRQTKGSLRGGCGAPQDQGLGA